MKNIVRIGFDIPSTNEDYIRIDENDSLSDYDIAFFSPDLEYARFYFDSDGYEGKTLYDKSSSSRILQQTLHWNNEINSFLKSGKTIFINLKRKKDFFIYSGKKTYSGTGKSQQTTYHVQPHSNYHFIPFSNNINNAQGKIINVENSLVSSFYDEFKNYINYEAYIENDKSSVLFTTRNKDKILGSYAKVYSGYMVFIPYIDFYVESLIQENKETEEDEWTDEAIAIGKRFIKTLIDIDKTLRKDIEKTPKPKWADNNKYKLREAEETKRQIKSNIMKIKELEFKSKKLHELLLEQESLKDLLFESGKPLEQAVISALKILGFQAENYDDGNLELDQIIISPEKIRYIGECEGKDKKDIDVSKFRQLQDSLNEDFEREEIEEKAYGLLFGNPKRLIEPGKRGVGFTAKCLRGAQREKIGLIRTYELYIVCKKIIEEKDENYKNKCRLSIKNQLGKIIEFPKD